jgi:hypothetical protein
VDLRELAVHVDVLCVSSDAASSVATWNTHSALRPRPASTASFSLDGAGNDIATCSGHSEEVTEVVLLKIG